MVQSYSSGLRYLMYGRILATSLLAAVLIGASWSGSVGVRPQVSDVQIWAHMRFSSHITDFDTDDHLKFTNKTETFPAITNCDVTSGYTTTGNVASIGRCNLVPGVYSIFLGVNGVDNTTPGTCYSKISMYNTTTTWPESGGNEAPLTLWVARYDISSNVSMLGANQAILTVTAQSWLEARFMNSCTEWSIFDHGSMVIHRVGDYIP